MGLFKTSIGDDWIAKRNQFIGPRIGTDPAQSMFPGMNIQDMTAEQMGQQGAASGDYQKKWNAEQDAWFNSLSPQDAQAARDAFAARQADFDKSHKIGKGVSLGIIGSALGGAALAAAGGAGASAGAAAPGAGSTVGGAEAGLGYGGYGGAGGTISGQSGLLGGTGIASGASPFGSYGVDAASTLGGGGGNPFSFGGTGASSAVSGASGMADFFGGGALDWAKLGLGAYSALRPGPDAPDYNALAQQQGDQNTYAAQLSAALNRLNENTPYGSVKYSSKANPNTPGGYDYSRDISLSPEQQQLYDLDSANSIKSQQTAGSLQDRVGQSVKDPFSLSNYGQAGTMGTPGSGERVADGRDPFSVNGPEARDLGNAANYAGGADAVGKAMYDRELALIQPQMERDTAGLDTQLRNQGLMPGTQAYDTALQQLRQQQGQNLNDLAGRATQARGAEQTRLAGLDLGLDAQRFGQSQTGFTNTMGQIGQDVSQRLATTGANNATSNDDFNRLLSSLGFNNQVRDTNIQQGLVERQQPLQEFNSFRTGNSPTLPSFQPYGMSQVQPTNTYGAAKDQYGAAVNDYNLKSGQWQSLLNLGAKVGG